MKIYVSEMPECCIDCPCRCYDLDNDINKCNALDSVIDYYDIIHEGKKRKDCPLIDIADHDAELLKNAIVPKFNNKQFVYALYTDTDIIRGQIESFDYYSKSYLIFFGDDVGNDWIPEFLVFKTKKEAEAKLKELRGENL